MIVLDEFQFIARQEPEIGSLLNRFVREHAANPGLMLCVSGSDISFFEKQVVGYGATSYGRRTASLKLRPFRWREAGAFAPGWSAEERIRAWAALGGVPYYLKEIDSSRPLRETILRAVLNPDGLLRDEPRFLLSQESRLRDVDTYMSCLRAIAAGVTRLNEIAQRIGRSRSEEARPFLQTLEEMGLVERRRPLAGRARGRVSYAVADPFLRFWFRFVAPRESRLHTREQARLYMERAVAPRLDKFVSEDAFERICQDWLRERLDDAVEAGRWWGPIRRREEGKLRSRTHEADAVAVGEDGEVLALGSCKWPTGDSHEHSAAELDKLERIREELDAPRARLFRRGPCQPPQPIRTPKSSLCRCVSTASVSHLSPPVRTCLLVGLDHGVEPLGGGAGGPGVGRRVQARPAGDDLAPVDLRDHAGQPRAALLGEVDAEPAGPGELLGQLEQRQRQVEGRFDVERLDRRGAVELLLTLDARRGHERREAGPQPVGHGVDARPRRRPPATRPRARCAAAPRAGGAARAGPRGGPRWHSSSKPSGPRASTCTIVSDHPPASAATACSPAALSSSTSPSGASRNQRSIAKAAAIISRPAGLTLERAPCIRQRLGARRAAGSRGWRGWSRSSGRALPPESRPPPARKSATQLTEEPLVQGLDHRSGKRCVAAGGEPVRGRVDDRFAPVQRRAGRPRRGVLLEQRR